MRNQTLIFLVSSLVMAYSCTTSKTTNTARTSTEQLLVASAVDQSLDKIDFAPFYAHTIFVNDKYMDCVDKSYVVGSVRHRVLQAGGRLVDSADKAEVIVEIRSGAVGTMSAESFVGVPEIVLPGVLTLPEIRIAERKSQIGTAKIGLVAYETATGQALGSGGLTLAQSADNNWYVAGTGPFRSGELKTEINDRTTGPAAQQRNRIPGVVAFNSPQPVPTQIAASEEPDPTVDPVSLEQPADQPTWVTPATPPSP